jgi:hypothetical protein
MKQPKIVAFCCVVIRDHTSSNEIKLKAGDKVVIKQLNLSIRVVFMGEEFIDLYNTAKRHEAIKFSDRFIEVG